MPVSAKRQAELRAMKREPRELKRKRCDNCGKPFVSDHPRKRFCAKTCSDEFHRYGAAFGPLKEKMEKLVRRWVREEIEKLWTRDGWSKGL